MKNDREHSYQSFVLMWLWACILSSQDLHRVWRPLPFFWYSAFLLCSYALYFTHYKSAISNQPTTLCSFILTCLGKINRCLSLVLNQTKCSTDTKVYFHPFSIFHISRSSNTFGVGLTFSHLLDHKLFTVCSINCHQPMIR